MPGQVFGGIPAAIDGCREVIQLVVRGQIDGADGGNVVELGPFLVNLLGGGYAVDVHHGCGLLVNEEGERGWWWGRGGGGMA